MADPGETFQTVTFVPSENNGEVSYVLVVQEEKAVVNIDLKVPNQVGCTIVLTLAYLCSFSSMRLLKGQYEYTSL